MSKRKFAWDAWNFDGAGNAYIISKDICPKREDVPGFVIRNDGLDPMCLVGENEDDHLSVESVREGWCKYQCRSDWEDFDGPSGGYLVEECKSRPTSRKSGKPAPGWFPVWIVRQGYWY